MEKGSNAKIHIVWHCCNQMIFWTQTDLVALFSGFQWPMGYKVQILLQVFKPFSLVIHESPSTFHPNQVNYLIEVLNTHTSTTCTDRYFCLEWVSLACSSSGLSFFLQHSIPSVWAPLLLSAHSTLHWPPRRHRSLSLFASLVSRETVNSLREAESPSLSP